jgi:hypothetical protein
MTKQLTKDEAIAFANAKSWEGMSYSERALFQVNQECLCMPFSVFQTAVEETVGQPMFTHMFADADLIREMLNIAIVQAGSRINESE